MIKYIIYDKEKKEPILTPAKEFTYEELLKIQGFGWINKTDVLLGSEGGIVTIIEPWAKVKAIEGLEDFSDEEALEILETIRNMPPLEAEPERQPLTLEDAQVLGQQVTDMELAFYEVLEKLNKEGN